VETNSEERRDESQIFESQSLSLGQVLETPSFFSQEIESQQSLNNSPDEKKQSMDLNHSGEREEFNDSAPVNNPDLPVGKSPGQYRFGIFQSAISIVGSALNMFSRAAVEDDEVADSEKDAEESLGLDDAGSGEVLSEDEGNEGNEGLKEKVAEDEPSMELIDEVSEHLSEDEVVKRESDWG
jgi:hypothetical protein